MAADGIEPFHAHRAGEAPEVDPPAAAGEPGEHLLVPRAGGRPGRSRRSRRSPAADRRRGRCAARSGGRRPSPAGRLRAPDRRPGGPCRSGGARAGRSSTPTPGRRRSPRDDRYPPSRPWSRPPGAGCAAIPPCCPGRSSPPGCGRAPRCGRRESRPSCRWDGRPGRSSAGTGSCGTASRGRRPGSRWRSPRGRCRDRRRSPPPWPRRPPGARVIGGTRRVWTSAPLAPGVGVAVDAVDVVAAVEGVAVPGVALALVVDRPAVEQHHGDVEAPVGRRGGRASAGGRSTRDRKGRGRSAGGRRARGRARCAARGGDGARCVQASWAQRRMKL